MKNTNRKLANDIFWNDKICGIGRYAREVYRAFPNTPTYSSRRLGNWSLRHRNRGFYTPGFFHIPKKNEKFTLTIHDTYHLDNAARNPATLYYKNLLKNIIPSAFAVITVSEYSRQRIIEHYGVSDDRVFNYSAGSNLNSAQGTMRKETHMGKTGKGFIFSCTNRSEHKNDKVLIRAFAQSGLSKDLDLILSGNPTKELKTLILKLKLENEVRFAGLVSDDDLTTLYSKALFTCFVSTYEGFGLPVLESMSLGTACLASDIPVLREIGSESIAYCEASNVESVAFNMQTLAADTELRQSLVESGKIQSLNYSWRRTSEQIQALLANMM